MAPRLLSCATWILLAVPGCSQLQVASAGEVGCAPGDIEVVDVERKWGTEAWRAVCGEQVFQCSSVATAQAVDYSCALLDEAPPPKEMPADDAEPEDEGDEETTADEAGDDETPEEAVTEVTDDEVGSDDDAAMEEPDDASEEEEDGAAEDDEVSEDDDAAADEPSDPPSDTGR